MVNKLQMFTQLEYRVFKELSHRTGEYSYLLLFSCHSERLNPHKNSTTSYRRLPSVTLCLGNML